VSILDKGASVPLFGHVTLGALIVGVVVGYVFRPQIQKIPGLNRLPQA